MQSQTKVTLLAGGVGGSRMALGFSLLEEVELTVIVNVADDDVVYGLYVAADIDTVVYRLAGIEGQAGWGRRDESWTVMEELSRLGVETGFRLGDRDLAINLYRTERMAAGTPLSTITHDVARSLGVETRVLPVSDDPIRTYLEIADGSMLDFQTYFVRRRHQDAVAAVTYRGIELAKPAPGVIEAIDGADIVVLAPSNPILSLRPILGVPSLAAAISAKETLVAISPLVDGTAVKGPTVDLLLAAGYEPTNEGIVSALGVLPSHLVADVQPEGHRPWRTLVTETRIASPDEAARLAREVLVWAR